MIPVILSLLNIAGFLDLYRILHGVLDLFIKLVHQCRFCEFGCFCSNESDLTALTLVLGQSHVHLLISCWRSGQLFDLADGVIALDLL